MIPDQQSIRSVPSNPQDRVPRQTGRGERQERGDEERSGEGGNDRSRHVLLIFYRDLGNIKEDVHGRDPVLRRIVGTPVESPDPSRRRMLDLGRTTV
jgi:hypothetical protein